MASKFSNNNYHKLEHKNVCYVAGVLFRYTARQFIVAGHLQPKAHERVTLCKLRRQRVTVHCYPRMSDRICMRTKRD